MSTILHSLANSRQFGLTHEADVGFAPFTGGALSYIDGMGAKAFVALCDRLAKQCGPRFAAPALLREMAAKRETFYGRFGTRKAA